MTNTKMVIKTIKITLSVANASDLIRLLQHEGAIQQELNYEDSKNLINKMCEVILN